MIARVVLAALALAASAAPASAAPLPTLGAADGVSITAAGHDYTFRFAGASTTAAAAYVGRKMDIQCEQHSVPGLLFTDGGVDSSVTGGTLRQQADGTLTLGFHLSASGFDLCAVTRAPQPHTVGFRGPFRIVTGSDRPPLARVALTPAGTTWIEELGHAAAMSDAVQSLTDQAHYPLPAAVARPGVVALDGPDGTPPAGTVGYWSDGSSRLAVITATGAGRRLVYEELADGVTRSNITGFSSAVNTLRTGPSFFLDTRRRDRDAHDVAGKRPKGVTSKDGVRATLAGTRLTVRFGGASAKALRAIAGRRVSVTCNAARLPATTGVNAVMDAFALVVVRAPRHGTVLRARVKAGASDVCAITDDGADVATVTPTAAGRGLVQDLTAAVPLFAIELAPKGATTYLPAATLVAHHPHDLVALPGPDAFPPVGRVGIWTAGTLATITATSPTGHHIVAADEGNGVARTNLNALLFDGLLLSSVE